MRELLTVAIVSPDFHSFEQREGVNASSAMSGWTDHLGRLREDMPVYCLPCGTAVRTYAKDNPSLRCNNPQCMNYDQTLPPLPPSHPSATTTK